MAPLPAPAAVGEDSCICRSQCQVPWGYKLCRQSGTLQVFLRCLLSFFTTAGDPSLLGTERFVHSFHILFPFANRLLWLCISTYMSHTWQLSYCVTVEKPHTLLYLHLLSWRTESCVVNYERHRWYVLLVINTHAFINIYLLTSHSISFEPYFTKMTKYFVFFIKLISVFLSINSFPGQNDIILGVLVDVIWGRRNPSKIRDHFPWS